MEVSENSKPFIAPDYERIDFRELALKDTDFADVLQSGRGKLKFLRPEHVLQLTKTLLKLDFGLNLEMPNDRLCPAIPNRWAYLRWIQDLVDTTSRDFTRDYVPSRKVTGVDIGVGASCIYPLLGCAARPNWNFVGTEIDKRSFKYAMLNVSNNKVEDRIHILCTSALHSSIPLDALKIKRADFTMCNPPFYKSKAEMMATFAKDTMPHSVCTGSEVEMITDGGEAEYVTRMVDVSKELGDRVQWYTSQLGKFATLSIIVEKLKGLNCVNWAVGTLLPNAITKRWVIGWSWDDLRPPHQIARPIHFSSYKDLLPFPNCYFIDTHGHEEAAVISSLNTILSALSLRWSWNAIALTGEVLAEGDVWSRAARRKRKRQEFEESSPSNPATRDDKKVALGVRVFVRTDYVELAWLKGSDQVLWESFCAMLKRQLPSPKGPCPYPKVTVAPVPDRGPTTEDQVPVAKECVVLAKKSAKIVMENSAKP